MSNYEKVLELVEAFKTKITKDYWFNLQFEFHDLETDNLFQIEVKDGEINVYNSEQIQVEEMLVMNSETFDKLYKGEISPLTAFANEPDENGVMQGLINPKIKKQEDIINSAKTTELPENDRKDFYRRLHKLDGFFNKHKLNRVVVNENGSRVIHGVKAVGLYNDFDDIKQLAVYFKIEENKSLWQQAINKGIFVIKGNGILIVDNINYEIRKYEYYRIQSNSDNLVIVKNIDREPLELLYI
jgi:hypothetical protein